MGCGDEIDEEDNADEMKDVHFQTLKCEFDASDFAWRQVRAGCVLGWGRGENGFQKIGETGGNV